jgi:hypothetical protein
MDLSLISVLAQVCGPPGMMNAVSGDKASQKDQGEVGIFALELLSKTSECSSIQCREDLKLQYVGCFCN